MYLPVNVIKQKGSKDIASHFQPIWEQEKYLFHSHPKSGYSKWTKSRDHIQDQLYNGVTAVQWSYSILVEENTVPGLLM
jgi:hypothetical protein